MSIPIPSLETERLLLRGHAADDFDDSAAMWGDPDVTRYIGGRPSSREEVWSRLLRYVGHWAVLGFGYWVVRDKASGRFVGEVGFADFKRDLSPSFGSAPEMGWVLAPWAQGRGLASEAVQAGLGWIERQRGPGRTVCMVHPANAASIRVAVKNGYREWARTDYKADPAVLFER